MSDTQTVTQSDTVQIRVAAALYEELRKLAFDRRTNIREEADRMIELGLKKSEKRGA